MATDQMTPIERMTAYNQGLPVDRLPCVPIVGNTAARVIGAKVGDFKANGKLIAQAQVEAYQLFKYDIIRVFTDLYTQAEAMGAKVYYPEDETAYLEAPAINDISEIDRLEPADPYKDGNLPHHLEAMKIAAAKTLVPGGAIARGPRWWLTGCRPCRCPRSGRLCSACRAAAR